MTRFSVPKVKDGDKVIIGIGDSFTQGVGAYSPETWEKHNYRIDVGTTDEVLLKEQYKNSWVNQLCRDYLPGWKAVNLGHAGTGNRSAVKELYLQDYNLENISEGIVVYMLTGLERFDFIQPENQEDHNFFSMWPNANRTEERHCELWNAYHNLIYNDYFAAMELLLNLFEAQTFCKAHGFKLVVVSGFDLKFNKKWLRNQLKQPFGIFKGDKRNLIDKFDWDSVWLPDGNETIIQMLLKLEGHTGEQLSFLERGTFYSHYLKLDKPGEYISNCAHPNLKGQEVIAKELYKHLCERGYV